MAVGVTLYVIYRRAQGKSLTQRFTIPAEALQEGTGAEYGSILVPVFGEELDDDIIGTAGRLAASDMDDETLRTLLARRPGVKTLKPYFRTATERERQMLMRRRAALDLEESDTVEH
jgi:hypothetical protein